ncbi:MAG: dodecin family protein [Steroidobacteraceae bacterium]
MSIAKVVEIIASSEKSFDDAVRKGVARATETVSDIASAWVKDQNVLVERGKVIEYRVTLKVTFVLKDKKK